MGTQTALISVAAILLTGIATADVPLPDPSSPHRCSVAKSERLRSARLGPPPPVTTFDVEHYSLEISVDLDTRTIDGVCAITATSEVTALSSVPIDLHDDLVVTSITHNGTSLDYARGNHRLNSG